jgi:hypothetical protein
VVYATSSSPKGTSWQVRDPFDPERLFAKIRSGAYDWDDLQRLIRGDDRPEPEQVIRSVETRFSVLHQLTDLERELIAEARKGRNERLADRLRREIRDGTP